MVATYIRKVMHKLQCVFKENILHVFGRPSVWACQKVFNIRVFSDTINVINVKLDVMVLHIELYLLALFFTLSVTLTLFQGHSSISFS